MNAIIETNYPPAGRSRARPAQILDPIEHDSPGDERLVTTRRAVCRIATVAAEAGARFQRDGVGIDPMAWMLAPRRMFDGVAPIDACLARGPFLRGVLVHGLALDLDMDPDDLDALFDDEAGDAPVVVNGSDQPGASSALRLRPPPPRLFTATVVCRDGVETVHAFHASLAIEAGEVMRRLHFRIGAASSDAVIVEGFDPTNPMVEAMVAPAIVDMLAQVARNPLSPLAAGLDLNVEQRFHG